MVCFCFQDKHKGARVMRERVQAALSQVRPTLQKDGGDVVLVEVTDDGIVRVQLTGACKGCPMSQMTLKEGIEKFIKAEVPEVSKVESV
jgi:Fe-S cluster biogenesis protein NfuA